MTNTPEPTVPDHDPEKDIPEIADSSPTTAEQAMDADGDGEGFVDESAYTPAKP